MSMSSIEVRKRKSRISSVTVRDEEIRNNQSTSKSTNMNGSTDVHAIVQSDADDAHGHGHGNGKNAIFSFTRSNSIIHRTSPSSLSNKKAPIIILFYTIVLLAIFTISFLLPTSTSISSSSSRNDVVVIQTSSQQVIHDTESINSNGNTNTSTDTNGKIPIQNLYNEDIMKNAHHPTLQTGEVIHEIHEQRTFTSYKETETETGKDSNKDNQNRLYIEAFVMNVFYPKFDLQDIFHDYDEGLPSQSQSQSRTSSNNRNNNLRDAYQSKKSKSIAQQQQRKQTSKSNLNTIQKNRFDIDKEKRGGTITIDTSSTNINNHEDDVTKITRNCDCDHESCADANDNDNAILTRRGYKGGPIDHQTNQDRAIIIKPFPFYEQLVQHHTISKTTNNKNNCKKLSFSLFLGIFDGHGEDGHLVSNFVQQYLPKVLSINLASIAAIQKRDTMSIQENKDEKEDYDDSYDDLQLQQIKQAILQSFQMVDNAIPHKIAINAGCTASTILQIDHKTIVTANVGDSTSFILAYSRSIRSVYVIYETTKHKPDMKEERERIERMGGQVDIPSVKEHVINGIKMDVSSRVVVPKRGGVGSVSIAMSRSLGDHDGRFVGVTGEPTVEILKIESLMMKAKQESRIAPINEKSNQEMELFAIAASDGVLDYLKPSDVAKRLEPSLYNMIMGGNTNFLQQGCEELILEASNSWLGLDFNYRDDITIAISKINQL